MIWSLAVNAALYLLLKLHLGMSCRQSCRQKEWVKPLFYSNSVQPTPQLESYDDQNFLVLHTSPDGGTRTSYLLKVHNGVESESPAIIGEHFAECARTEVNPDNVAASMVSLMMPLYDAPHDP